MGTCSLVVCRSAVSADMGGGVLAARGPRLMGGRRNSGEGSPGGRTRCRTGCATCSGCEAGGGGIRRASLTGDNLGAPSGDVIA